MEALRGAHIVVKGLEKEKFALVKCNDQLECSARDLKAELEKLKAELKLERSKLSNGVLLEETFRKHPDFDGFAKDFSDADFRFLMKGVRVVALELDLEPIKLRYAEKWASSPNQTPGPRVWWISIWRTWTPMSSWREKITRASRPRRLTWRTSLLLVLLLLRKLGRWTLMSLTILASQGELKLHL